MEVRVSPFRASPSFVFIYPPFLLPLFASSSSANAPTEKKNAVHLARSDAYLLSYFFLLLTRSHFPYNNIRDSFFPDLPNGHFFCSIRDGHFGKVSTNTRIQLPPLPPPLKKETPKQFPLHPPLLLLSPPPQPTKEDKRTFLPSPSSSANFEFIAPDLSDNASYTTYCKASFPSDFPFPRSVSNSHSSPHTALSIFCSQTPHMKLLAPHMELLCAADRREGDRRCSWRQLFLKRKKGGKE